MPNPKKIGTLIDPKSPLSPVESDQFGIGPRTYRDVEELLPERGLHADHVTEVSEAKQWLMTGLRDNPNAQDPKKQKILDEIQR